MGIFQCHHELSTQLSKQSSNSEVYFRSVASQWLFIQMDEYAYQFSILLVRTQMDMSLQVSAGCQSIRLKPHPVEAYSLEVTTFRVLIAPTTTTSGNPKHSTNNKNQA
ncbi:hypothetical protein CK203_070502 [Vitis vinifera]|uniref:Uncharacterized protein n=1 Tax=Vitis vinifera TaxID=29760 RepID=A0A438FAS9_VITVI|nr:hypothetical protein CK203_070502 [Vitis vinifera]